MRRAEGRDEQWFAASYRGHEPAVRRYAIRRVGTDEADDLVAEVFATLWRRRADAPEHLLPWLYGVAANHLAHLNRSRARSARLTDRLAALPEPAQQAPAQWWQLVDLFEFLDESDGEILRLAYWEDLGSDDIAVVLGCSPGAARVRLHRARKRAAAHLAPQIRPAGLVPEATIDEGHPSVQEARA